MVTLEKEGNIFILTIPKAFTPPDVDSILQKLVQVQSNEGPTALVITGSHPKLFSGGMDLQYIREAGTKGGIDLFKKCMRMFGKVLSLGVPTVAAIDGHCIAAGYLLACAMDYRIMSAGKGTIKMTEIEIGMCLPRGGNIMLAIKLHPAVQRDLVLRARQFTPQEGLSEKLVDELVPSGEVLNRAKQQARDLADFGKLKNVYRALKISSYKQAIEVSLAAEYTREEEESVEKTFNPKL